MLTSVDKFPTQIAGMKSKFMLYLFRGDTMTLGNRLYEMRKAKGLSQENVADVLGVTRQTVSKWETDQSTPDFDKIIPLCELYGISTEELLTGKKTNSNSTNSDADYNTDDKFHYYTDNYSESTTYNEETIHTHNPRKKFAILISIAVCMYILSVTPLIAFDGSTTAVVLFFIIIALATMLIVFGALSRPKNKNNDEDNEAVMTNQKKLYKQITGILSGITLCIYLVISFLTNYWHITWLIWVIHGIICKIIDLILTLKESEKDGEK